MNRLKGYLLMCLWAIVLSLGTISARDAMEPLVPITPDPNLQGKAEPMETPGLLPRNQGQSNSKKDKCSAECSGVKLNTCFPIIGNCIESKDATGAFPTMMGALAKIVVSLILVVCFILIIVGGIMWAADKPKEGKDLIKKVAITILLLGFSGVILRLVNPNFFG